MFTSEYSPEFLAEDSGGLVIAVASIFIVFDIGFSSLRIAARRITPAAFGWDDYLLILSLISNLAMYTLSICMVCRAGLGRHEALLLIEGTEKLILWAKYMYALEWLYLISTALPRLSVLCLYLRIFPRRFFPRSFERRASYTLMVVIVCHVTASVTSSFFQCIPFKSQVDKSIVGRSCSDQLNFHRWISFPNIPIDVAILVVPVRMMWLLQISRKRKLALVILFLIGNLGVAFSCVRFSYLISGNPFAEDGTWASVYVVIWTIVESGMYLKAACLPSLYPVRNLIVEAIQRISNGGKSSGSQPPHSTWESRMRKGDPLEKFIRDSLHKGRLDEEGQVTKQEQGYQGCGSAGTVQDGATIDNLNSVGREGERHDILPV